MATLIPDEFHDIPDPASRHQIVERYATIGKRACLNLGVRLHRNAAARAKWLVRDIRQELRELVRIHGGKNHVPPALVWSIARRERLANKDAAWHLARLAKLG